MFENEVLIDIDDKRRLIELSNEMIDILDNYPYYEIRDLHTHKICPMTMMSTAKNSVNIAHKSIKDLYTKKSNKRGITMDKTKIIDCRSIAKGIKHNIKEYIGVLKLDNKRVPKLVTILVGDNHESVRYVTWKEKDCNEVGIKSEIIRVSGNISQYDLLEIIEELNYDYNVDGILVQLPLPSHINEKAIMSAIDPEKDVDCFNPINIGIMNTNMTNKYPFLHILPCTPHGILMALRSIGYDSLEGMDAVVIGRSDIVGKPIGKILMDMNATVTICHSKTKNIKDKVKNADIIISAAGVPKMIKSDWVKNGCVIIDVGINQDENGKLCGDVDLEDVIDKVKYITPVPKGIGLLTRAMLLFNTVELYRKNSLDLFLNLS